MAIGGFFELELPHNGEHYHSNAIALSTGRACISLIINKVKPLKVFVPFYTCNAVYEPFTESGIEIEYYNINENLEAISLPDLKSDEYFLLINFFGIQRKYVSEMIEIFGNNLIIDNTHDFFHKEYPANWSFTSARKYFGVPDGAFLYPKVNNIELSKIQRFKDIDIRHLYERFIGHNQVAYELFKEYEEKFNCQIKQISKFSEALLKNIDYKKVLETRKNNFFYLHSKLEKYNRLEFDVNHIESPFCYPFWPKKYIDKKYFHNRDIFIPALWNDVLTRDLEGFNLERLITNELLPLPIDHRYSTDHMSEVIEAIEESILSC